MPCFIGIIQFLRCRHCLLFKLGCTNNCDELCPTEKQVPLVATNYLWLCEDCHERKANVNLDERCNEWADLMMDIPKGDTQLHSMMENAIRSREKADDVACEKSRVQCNEEIQWVAEWTLEYGLMIYDVLFKQMWEPQRAAERIQQLRGLRVWDLLVVKDALRSPKVLFEEQWNETYWFISDQFAEQHLLRKQQQKPPARKRPPVPLFPWKENEDERQSRESSMSSQGLDSDGDVTLTDVQDEPVHTKHDSATLSSPIRGDGHLVTDDTAMD